MGMSKKEKLLSIAEQLCDLGIVVENMAKKIDGEIALRTEPTMPIPQENLQAKQEQPELLLQNEETVVAEPSMQQGLQGVVVDPADMLGLHNIANPVWSYTISQAAALMGVPEHTVRHLAENCGLAHFMSTNTGRGAFGRARRYSWTVCVRYMANAYTGCYRGTVEALPEPGIVLLNLAEAATMLEVCTNTVTEWCKAGKMNCMKYGTRRYFFPTDVLDCKNRNLDNRGTSAAASRFAELSNGSI